MLVKRVALCLESKKRCVYTSNIYFLTRLDRKPNDKPRIRSARRNRVPLYIGNRGKVV